jgi:hypothetical protein
MSARTVQSKLAAIDALMERASKALVDTRYFECQRVCLQALARAHRQLDFERMARITLPLQEARRQRRQLAVDASFPPSRKSGHSPGVRILDSLRSIPRDPAPGCYLFQPPLIAADARAFRDAADAAEIPVFVLSREPFARDGTWPIASVGVVTVRTKVQPPFAIERDERRVTKDFVTSADAWRISRIWFEETGEALGDSAIARLRYDEPAAWRVEDLLEFIDAFPDHEKLHQRLDEACRQAMTEPLPEEKRRRGIAEDPYSF